MDQVAGGGRPVVPAVDHIRLRVVDRQGRQVLLGDLPGQEGGGLVTIYRDKIAGVDVVV